MTYCSLLGLILLFGAVQEGTVTLYHSGGIVGYGRVVEISRNEQAASLDVDLDDTPDLCLPVRRLHSPVDDVGTIPGIGSFAAFSLEGRRLTGRVIGLDGDMATVAYVLERKRYRKQLPTGNFDGCLAPARVIGRGQVVPPRDWHFRSGKILSNMSFLDCDEEHLNLLPASAGNIKDKKITFPARELSQGDRAYIDWLASQEATLHIPCPPMESRVWRRVDGTPFFKGKVLSFSSDKADEEMVTIHLEEAYTDSLRRKRTARSKVRFSEFALEDVADLETQRNRWPKYFEEEFPHSKFARVDGPQRIKIDGCRFSDIQSFAISAAGSVAAVGCGVGKSLNEIHILRFADSPDATTRFAGPFQGELAAVSNDGSYFAIAHRDEADLHIALCECVSGKPKVVFRSEIPRAGDYELAFCGESLLIATCSGHRQLIRISKRKQDSASNDGQIAYSLTGDSCQAIAVHVGRGLVAMEDEIFRIRDGRPVVQCAVPFSLANPQFAQDGSTIDYVRGDLQVLRYRYRISTGEVLIVHSESNRETRGPQKGNGRLAPVEFFLRAKPLLIEDGGDVIFQHPGRKSALVVDLKASKVKGRLRLNGPLKHHRGRWMWRITGSSGGEALLELVELPKFALPDSEPIPPNLELHSN